MTTSCEFRDRSAQHTVPLPAGLKTRLRQSALVSRLWTQYRRRQLHAEYDRRREHYATQARARGLVYSLAEVKQQVRDRLQQRGYSPTVRRLGDIHTFACIPLFSWHKHLLPDLHELGPVTHFDYTALGYSVEVIARAERAGRQQREQMLKHVLPAVLRAHREQPIDWIFCYGGGQDTSPAVMRQITAEIGVPIVNMSLDDKQGWAGRWTGECRTGAVDITEAFDLYMTSARVACEWHLVEGGRSIYLPEGFSAAAYKPRLVQQDIEVSFVGAAYGVRVELVRYLQQRGIAVRAFGTGWPGTGWADDPVEIFNRSRINLGMGGIQYSDMLTNVKGRDFEIPATGGGLYLTSFNADLAQHFEVGREIVCYRSRDDMLELTRHYLAHPAEAQMIAQRARERSMREHRWLHRYQKILSVIGVLEAE